MINNTERRHAVIIEKDTIFTIAKGNGAAQYSENEDCITLYRTITGGFEYLNFVKCNGGYRQLSLRWNQIGKLPNVEVKEIEGK